MSKKIYNNDFWLNLLISYGTIPFYFYYRNLYVRGLKNIPKDAEVILAPNHQNASQDPMMILFSKGKGHLYKKGDNLFLARADIFENKTLKKLLNFLKINPIYRIRDGFDSLGKNEQVFNEAVEALHHGMHLCVMPEGNHGNQRKLRPLQKGIFRMAFRAQEKYGKTPMVKIVPVGIDYTEYVYSGYSAIVDYGKPIDVSEYVDTYNEDPAIAINAIKKRLVNELSSLIINVQSTEHYDAIYQSVLLSNHTICRLLNQKLTKLNLFDIRKDIANKLCAAEKNNDPIINKLENLTQSVRKLHPIPIYNELLVKGDHYLWLKWMLFFLLLPIIIFGGVFNFVPCLLAYIPSKKFKDRQFVCSFRFATGIFFSIVFFGAYLIVAAFLLSWVQFLLFVPLLGISSFISIRMVQTIKLPFIRLSYLFGKKKKNLIQARKDFIEINNLITELYKK